MSNLTSAVYFSTTECASNQIFRSLTSSPMRIIHGVVVLLILGMVGAVTWAIKSLWSSRIFKKATKPWLLWALLTGIGHFVVVGILHGLYLVDSFQTSECQVLLGFGECTILNISTWFTELLPTVFYLMMSVNAVPPDFVLTSSGNRRKTFSACVFMTVVITPIVAFISGVPERKSEVYSSTCYVDPVTVSWEHHFVRMIPALLGAVIALGLKRSADATNKLAKTTTFQVTTKYGILRNVQGTRVTCFTMFIYVGSIITSCIIRLILIYFHERIPTDLLIFFPVLPEGSIWANFFAAVFLGHRARNIKKSRQKENAELIRLEKNSAAVRDRDLRDTWEGRARY